MGSADFLEALGAVITLDGPQTAAVVDGCGFGFLFAPMFHPAMKHVAAVRKQLGVRTVFNLLGPLTNPTRPKYMVVGVGSRDLGPLFAELFRLRQAERILVMHSTDGVDEISIAADTLVWEVTPDGITERTISPVADFGLAATSPLDAVCGGTPAERAAAFRAVLAGTNKVVASSK